MENHAIVQVKINIYFENDLWMCMYTQNGLKKI